MSGSVTRNCLQFKIPALEYMFKLWWSDVKSNKTLKSTYWLVHIRSNDAKLWVFFPTINHYRVEIKKSLKMQQAGGNFFYKKLLRFITERQMLLVI